MKIGLEDFDMARQCVRSICLVPCMRGTEFKTAATLR